HHALDDPQTGLFRRAKDDQRVEPRTPRRGGEFHYIDVVANEQGGFSGGARNPKRFGYVCLPEQVRTTLPHEAHEDEERNVHVRTIKRPKLIRRPCSTGEQSGVNRDSDDDRQQDRYSEQEEKSRRRSSQDVEQEQESSERRD